jgi:hypothetical protein
MCATTAAVFRATRTSRNGTRRFRTKGSQCKSPLSRAHQAGGAPSIPLPPVCRTPPAPAPGTPPVPSLPTRIPRPGIEGVEGRPHPSLELRFVAWAFQCRFSHKGSLSRSLVLSVCQCCQSVSRTPALLLLVPLGYRGITDIQTHREKLHFTRINVDRTLSVLASLTATDASDGK